MSFSFSENDLFFKKVFEEYLDSIAIKMKWYDIDYNRIKYPIVAILLFFKEEYLVNNFFSDSVDLKKYIDLNNFNGNKFGSQLLNFELMEGYFVNIIEMNNLWYLLRSSLDRVDMIGQVNSLIEKCVLEEKIISNNGLVLLLNKV